MAGGAAAAAAIAQAVKASGAIVRIEPEGFLSIVERAEAPLVVHETGGFLSVVHKYLVGYKGLVFFTQAPRPLYLSGTSELVEAQKIWIPG